jgi:hypothetical protein
MMQQGASSSPLSELGTGNITEGLYKWTNTVTAPTNLIISGSNGCFKVR